MVGGWQAMGLFRRRREGEGQPEGQPEGEGQPPAKKKGYHKRFAQQELWGWSPIITGNVVVVYFFAAGVLCLALGVPILLASLRIVEVKARYDNAGVMAGQTLQEQQKILRSSHGAGVQTAVNFTIPQDMQPPVRPPGVSL